MSAESGTHNDVPSESAVSAPSDVVGSIKGFIGREGGTAKAVLQPIGAAGVRITLVGEKGGILGDRVVADLATAQAVVDAIDGLETAEWDRDLTSAANVKPSHYRQMAGWVANQSRFPKPRNRAIL
ncbi:hypothetical protein [Gordonia rhizosphera]|uniref:Uncharacterized protein n=1 Tax=Gordonia rhizosphera NBRC 16068 TaxID=1108045 RepID=K6WJS4_9ACTN|nr:hypothetical protein [Gordonia rhizosphera]GAB92397.1 hypothetical protein GORHZ_173_00060 [Gordonia rhizosphera NBRC 16068]